MAITDKSYIVGDMSRLEVDADPRVTAVDASAGSRIFWFDPISSTIREFSKVDGGATTNVFEVNFNSEYQETDLNGVPVVVTTIADNADKDLITNWVTVLTMNSIQNLGGEYVYFNQCFWDMTSTVRKVYFRAVIDGSALFPLAQETKDVENVNPLPVTIHPNQIFPNWDIPFNHTFTIQAIIAQGAGADPTLTMDDCLISLERKK